MEVIRRVPAVFISEQSAQVIDNSVFFRREKRVRAPPPVLCLILLSGWRAARSLFEPCLCFLAVFVFPSLGKLPISLYVSKEEIKKKKNLRKQIAAY